MGNFKLIVLQISMLCNKAISLIDVPYNIIKYYCTVGFYKETVTYFSKLPVLLKFDLLLFLSRDLMLLAWCFSFLVVQLR